MVLYVSLFTLGHSITLLAGVLLNRRRQAESVEEAEDEDRDLGIRLDTEEASKAVHIVERLVYDGEADDGVDDEWVRLYPPENAHEQRNAVSQCEETHVRDHVLKAVQEEYHPH